MSDISDTDLQLLARYTARHAEDAFAEIVRRHLGLVYSAALRQVRSPQLAEEVAQSVFTDLARNARRLAPDTILTAWLYQVACRTAIDVVRRESRRQLREHIASEMNAMNATASDWTHIEPLLDEAMQALDDTDRTAVLLRYFENKSLREVGATLGTSDDAAQKRVSRAVERLREFFAKRGVTVGASGLVVVISANAVQAAPVGLAAAITAGAFAGTVTGAAITTHIATTWITMKLTTGILIGAITAATGTYLLLHNKAKSPQNEDQALIAQQENSTPEQNTTPAAAPAKNNDEILRLRGEVGVLRRQTNELAQAQSKTRSFQADQLSQETKKAVGQLMIGVNLYTEDYSPNRVLTNLSQLKQWPPGALPGILIWTNLKSFLSLRP